VKNSKRFINILAICFKRCWIIGAIVAIAALVWLEDEPAWAGPQQQFTVPTATPQTFEPEPELVPTATPVSLFEPEEDNDSSSDNSDDQVFDEEPTPEPFFPNEEPDITEPTQPADDLFNDSNINEPIDNNVNTPQNSNNDDLKDDGSSDPSADLLDDIAVPVNSDPLDDFSDNSLTGGATGSTSAGSSTGSSSAGSRPSANNSVGSNVSAANSGIVSISVLNIRRDPSPEADIIDTMWRNDVVEISQTAKNGTWLLVCCGVERGSAGWVSSLFINYDASNLTVGTLDRAAATTASARATNAASTADTRLEITMSVTDTTVQAGQILDIIYSVENLGTVDAVKVQVNNELPEDLFLNNFEMDATGQFTHTLNAQNDRRIFNISWPEIAAAQTVTATVTVQIAPGAPNGVVIDNLAGVIAENAEGDTAAISVGTPPLAPPSFRRR